jgi:hypothetical protein
VRPNSLNGWVSSPVRAVGFSQTCADGVSSGGVAMPSSLFPLPLLVPATCIPRTNSGAMTDLRHATDDGR